MKVTFNELDKLYRGLSVGYYLGRAIKHTLSETSEKTYYDPMSDMIVVSYPMLKQAIERVKGDKIQYSVLRGLFYHELSHAILTPKTLCTMPQWTKHHDILNTFEDERIETLLSNYFLDVNFRRNIIIIFNYKGEEATTPFEAFYNLVRYHKGEQVWLDRLTALICKYKRLTVQTTDTDLLNQYCDDVLAFYRDFTGKWEEQQEQQKNNQQSNEQEQNEDNNQSDSNSSSNNSSDEQNEENEDNQGSSSNDSTEDDTEDTEDNTEGSNGSSEEDDTEENEEGSEGSSNDSEDTQDGEDEEDKNKGSNSSSDDEKDGDGDDTASNGGSDDIEDCKDDEECEGLDPEVEDAIASVKELNIDDITLEDIKSIMQDAIENLFNQYYDPALETRLRKIIDMKLRKEMQRDGAINAYSGRLDPRSFGRKDWRIWLTDADRGCVRQFNTIHLICLIDSSGSMSGNDYKVNVFIRTLDRVAKDYPKFTFDIIQVDEQVIEWKDHNQKYSHRNTCNTLSFEDKQGAKYDLISVIRRHTKPQTNNYIVALFDGDFHSASYDKFKIVSAKDPIRKIDGVNTIIVTNEANRKYIEASCNRARVKYCSNYVKEFQNTVCSLLDQVL